MRRHSPMLSLSALLAFGFFFMVRLPLHSEQTQEYLSDAEIDQLRTEEGKDPQERIRLLSMFLKVRFERAKSVKSGIPYQEKGAKQKTSSDKKEPDNPEAKNSRETVPPRSFKGWMEDYLKCLDEISNNIEDFSTLRYEDPKPYQKSLKSLRASLEEQQQWILEAQRKGEKSEKEVIDDVLETLQDLLGDVTNSIDELNQQIEQMKGSRKQKSQSEK